MAIRTESLDQARERYALVVPSLRKSVAGLKAEQLTARPGPGDWSIHEVVIHVADSDLLSWDRMKRIAAMERPTLIPYDESAFMKTLCYHEQSLEDALALFETGRRRISRMLECLPAEAFERTGVHSEAGELSLFDYVERYVRHVQHHVEFIRAKRERMGIPEML